MKFLALINTLLFATIFIASSAYAKSSGKAVVVCDYGKGQGGLLRFLVDLDKKSAKISCPKTTGKVDDCILDDPNGEDMQITSIKDNPGKKPQFTTDNVNGNPDKIYFDGGNGDDTDLTAVMQIYVDDHQTLVVQSTLTVMVDGNLNQSSPVVTCEASVQ